MPYVLDSLREFGGSATPREVYEKVATLAKVPEEKRLAKLKKSGNLRFPNQVAWARQYLVWEGLVSSPKQGIWMLTSNGRTTRLTLEGSRELFLKWVAIHAKNRQGKTHEPSADQGDKPTEQQIEAETEAEQEAVRGYRDDTLSYLQSILPSEFERFCADLLRHLGMQRVQVIGGAGDKGIDGMGYLPTGPIVTTKVAFQCKRYSHAVGPRQVREFRGAIGHRAEKGIFFTTDYFTDAAREAAGEDMAKPIELIDGERLVELLEQYQFGLKEVKTYEVDYTFLANYSLAPILAKIKK